jgi:ABC-2 type transport system permease protein
MGSLAFIFLILSSTLNLLLLLDFDGDRYIDYQITILNPRLIVMEKIIFSTLFSFFVSLPFFIVSKIILRDELDTTNLSIPKLLLMILIGCFTCSAYSISAVCILKGAHRTGTWWRRVNNPMLMLGGSWVPWVAIAKVSPIIGYLVLLNPMIYMTEGIRGSIFGDNIYISFEYCITALIIFSAIFIVTAFHFFKKRTDHVG